MPTADNVQWGRDRRLDRVASPIASQFGQDGVRSGRLQGGTNGPSAPQAGSLFPEGFAVPAPWMVPGGELGGVSSLPKAASSSLGSGDRG